MKTILINTNGLLGVSTSKYSIEKIQKTDSYMTYRPIQIADYFLSKYGKDNEITPMKLIKLVYIAHGWYLAITDQTLIDENPEAWKYGPVISSLYHEFKHLGNSPIEKKFTKKVKLEEKAEKFLDKIWEVYGKFSATDLSSKTHQPETPWSKTWNSVKNANYLSLQIPENEIKNYYKSMKLETI